MDVHIATSRKRKQRTISSSARLVPAKVASVELGVSYGAIRDAHFRGEIAVVKIGKSWYFERAELNRWIETQRERGGQ